jgi:hypothetical protein
MNTRQTLQIVALLSILLSTVSPALAENIDPCDDGSQYAYGENVGWFNFEPNRPEPNVGATVSDHNVTGFIWAENIGWVNLDPNTAGVTNDGAGRLGGHAWAENVGWINFDPTVRGDANHYPPAPSHTRSRPPGKWPPAGTPPNAEASPAVTEPATETWTSSIWDSSSRPSSAQKARPITTAVPTTIKTIKSTSWIWAY